MNVKEAKSCNGKTIFICAWLFLGTQIFMANGQILNMGPITMSHSSSYIQGLSCITKYFKIGGGLPQYIDAPFAPIKYSSTQNKCILFGAWGTDQYIGTPAKPIQTWILPGGETGSNLNASAWGNWNTSVFGTNAFYNSKQPFILSIYRDTLTTSYGLLGIVHYEQVDESSPNADKADNYPYRIYSIGLAYSFNNGGFWWYLGDIITPWAQSAEASIQNDNDLASKWTCEYNIDGGAYIINPTKDSMYIYYSEAPKTTDDMNKVCYISFARAKLSNVLSHARTLASLSNIQGDWKKYNVAGDVPATGANCGIGSQVIKLPTATGGGGQGCNKAVYSSYAKEYYMLTHGWINGDTGPSLLMSSSSNGISWSMTGIIDYAYNPSPTTYSPGDVTYAFISALPNDPSAAYDFHQVGQVFYVHYLKYSAYSNPNGTTKAPGHDFYYRTVTLYPDISPIVYPFFQY